MNRNHASMMTRRQALCQAGTGLGMVGLVGLLHDAGLLGPVTAEAANPSLSSKNPLAPKATHFPARAKHVIHIYLNGGPSQVDTFDPKPLLKKYEGKMLPQGNLSTERKTGTALPSPFRFQKYGQSGIEMSKSDQRRQLDLLAELNHRHQQPRAEDDNLKARIASFELAYRMQMTATDAFDVEQEPQSIRAMYGPGVQARQLLIARRLIERGVRFIQLFHGDVQPWDSHDNIAGTHRSLGQQCDQAIAALLTDLKQRGLFEETLILCGGEFGRTPAVELVNGKPGMGRDHNHWGFSVWIAGGGVKGGHIHGATDEFGYRAVENPVHVHDLHATILHLLGFDHTKLTYRYAGRDFRLTDVEGEVVRDILA